MINETYISIWRQIYHYGQLHQMQQSDPEEPVILAHFGQMTSFCHLLSKSVMYELL